ncbi:MAG TPA: UDP-N-acetylmuramoyl-L-alanyl-D-glutamate--2,6-diaminopimelate ligase, partial [Chloroflexota bacterium]|nr:UDP-N-acetylmuramoyl-L-alanyl-D-glutamate--2,6-diaminopimelate ligase [Chloroflexota bacterium]
YDSRRVEPGDLFVAVPGTATDGHAHVGAAVAAGAVAVVVERAEVCVPDAPCLVVPSSRAALADLAAAFYGFPARTLCVTGITGTDGKTTSTFLLSHVLEGLGRRTGLIGTVALKIGDRWEENRARQSTPESPEIQQALAAMARDGVDDAVVEATSHGLALERVRRCAFDAALVTNVTSEHLDFHGTRERYLDAKARLLTGLVDAEGKQQPRYAAVNLDDEGSAALIPRSPVPVIGFGLGQSATLRGLNVRTRADGSSFDVAVAGQTRRAATPLPGLFNVYNCLGVLALIHGRGLDLGAAIDRLAGFTGVPGRMRRVDAGQPFTVIVDYAHTADSLQKVLQTVRPLATGRVIAVFGSAGDRDREKRPIMGRVAARYADYGVFTDEDPRAEPSLTIIDAIAAGAQAEGWREGAQYARIPDRRQAIAHALACAAPGDVVVLAGKGHEQSILVQGRSIPWDEEGTARDGLRALGYDG